MESRNVFPRFTLCKDDDSDFLSSLPNYHVWAEAAPHLHKRHMGVIYVIEI